MYSFVIIFLTSLVGILLAFGLERSPSLTLVTDRRTNVTYHGISNHGIDSFLNIPFGQDTGGPGRFAPPKPFIPAHNTIVNATAPGAACPQGLVPFPAITNILSNVTNVSEDCLNLRITRPSTPSRLTKLPEMVFIYGGGYQVGQIYDTFYTPDQLVKDSVSSGTPIIYVAMNYRLGIFGFARNELLQERKSLNVALRDQRLALEWIQENIHVFGGDPDRVTIFGESAGGTSIAAQILAFGGKQKPPFQQAIAESGLIGPGFAPLRSNTHFDEVVIQSGCEYGGPGSELSLDCLRSLSLESLIDVSLRLASTNNPFTIGEFYTPVVDGDFIPLEPSLLVKSGRFSRVPMVIGWNEDDGSLFTPPTVQTDEDIVAFLTELFPNLAKSTTNKIFQLYPLDEFTAIPSQNASAQFLRASRIFRDIEFTCPSLFLAVQAADLDSRTPTTSIYHPSASRNGPIQAILGYLGNSWNKMKEFATHSPPIFLYHLNQTSLAQNLSRQGFPQLGVSHIADIPYVFDEVDRFNDSASNALLAKQMTGSWSRFATSGYPSSSKGTNLKDWASAWRWEEKDSLEDAEVFVIGGVEPGMASLGGKGGNLRGERLPERCGFFFSEKVIRELRT